MSWNLAWWLTTTDYFRKCKNMEYQNSGPSGTLSKMLSDFTFSHGETKTVSIINFKFCAWDFFWIPPNLNFLQCSSENLQGEANVRKVNQEFKGMNCWTSGMKWNETFELQDKHGLTQENTKKWFSWVWPVLNCLNSVFDSRNSRN